MPKTRTLDRLGTLKAIPLFSDLSERSLRKILRTAAEFEAPAGWVLVQPHLEGSGVFIVEEGTVTVHTHRKTFDLGRGEFIGELALLVPEALREARVITKTPVRCLAIGRADFMKMLEEEPKIAIAMLKVLARRLVEAQK